MTTVQAVVLGIVQGLTEFLPVSSSGHLCLAQHLFGLKEHSDIVTFDVALHLASLLAILVVFAGRIRAVLTTERRMIGYIVLASVPVGIVGAPLGDTIEGLFVNPHAVAAALVFTGAALVFADWVSRDTGTENAVGVVSSLVMGFAQALAMVPGISRSGLTITGGLASGLSRKDAYEFSFLMAIPAILGAGAYKAIRSKQAWDTAPDALAVGMLVSFVFSIAGLILLKQILLSKKLKWLGAYCAVLGLGALCLL
jgi:undecaprenyl-diphosphatase